VVGTHGCIRVKKVTKGLESWRQKGIMEGEGKEETSLYANLISLQIVRHGVEDTPH